MNSLNKFIAILMLLGMTPGVSTMAAECQDARLSQALDRLEGKTRLHNCQIELVTRNSPSGLKQYMLLVNDLTKITGGMRPAVLFEFQIDPSCGVQDSLSGKTIRYSYGYSTPYRNYKVAIGIQMGQSFLPTRLMIQNIDLISNQVEQRVTCLIDSDET